MSALIYLIGFATLVYVLVKGFTFAYKPPTLAVNSGNPAFAIQV